MIPIVLAWAIGVVAQSAKVDLATGADMRVSAGQMAVSPDRRAVPAVDATLTLLNGVRVASKRYSFVLRYRPTYYYQLPNLTKSNWPLFLHQVDGSLGAALSRRTSFSWSGNARVGDINYSSLLRVLPSGTAASTSRLVPITSVGSSLTLAHRLSRTNSFSAGTTASYRTSTGSAPAFPTVASATVQLSDQVVLGRSDSLSMGGSITHFHANRFESGGAAFAGRDYGAGGVQLTLSHRTSRSGSLGVTAGVSAAGIYGDVPFSIFPTAAANFSSEFKALDTRWSISGMGGLQGFQDPLLGTFRPQGFLGATLSANHTADLSSSASLSLTSSVAGEPIRPPQYESSGSASWRLSYQLSPLFTTYGGVAWRLRAPHWSQWSSLPLQNEMTGFLGCRIRIGTGTSRGRWL